MSRVKLVLLIKKANKWRDFSVDTAKQGNDTAAYGYKADSGTDGKFLL
jgi:hypothetical protein